MSSQYAYSCVFLTHDTSDFFCKPEQVKGPRLKPRNNSHQLALVFCFAVALTLLAARAREDAPQALKVRIEWGHGSSEVKPFYIKLVPVQGETEIRQLTPYNLEPGDNVQDGVWQSRAGAGDVDGVELMLTYPLEPVTRIQNLHIIWSDLIVYSDPDTARRLSEDPALQTNSHKLTIQMNEKGTRGFTLAVQQLLRHRSIWIPSLDVYATAGDPFVSFDDYQKEIAPLKGQRVLDRVHIEPEASFEDFATRWHDMGHPAYEHPQMRGPGHIVGLTWDSAIPKFGIDRGAGVWNDYGNPDRFRFWFELGDVSQGLKSVWKSQSLKDGLPLITTIVEKEGVRYQIEQFACPLKGIPAERRGDISMVLLQKVTLMELLGNARKIGLRMSHRRELPGYVSPNFLAEARDNAVLFLENAYRRALFSIEGAGETIAWSEVRDYQREQRRIDVEVFLKLPAGASKEFIVKLPSPLVQPQDHETLLNLDYSAAREATLRFWLNYIERGARFEVPEKRVNDLFTANLWHALRLPRRHEGAGSDVQIDLPYSNFAYGQTGTPWPINQAVYVDYMLYDLRGYHEISTEELLVMYRGNQEDSGHINGYANWVVYTPGMLYATAKNYLLSRDRAALDRLLPYGLKALDWCLAETKQAASRPGPASGLVYGPLNDGTGNGVWAFNQAYMYAGLELFGRVLREIGHPRAQETLQAARNLAHAIDRAFGHATMRSPLVELRDHTWIPYVPCEVLTPRRLLDQWYPTDVDTGAVHLLRLKALGANGELADYLLNDHEDNLFLNGWGIANEPVYNQQATAYLLRDDPHAAIRAFYSYMASAFSHSALEPVEHRWTHGQYFGPPSTDGAWFELYRHMLIHELEDDSLLLGRAIPRKWLEHGNRIKIERAPTYFGRISFSLQSQANTGKIEAEIEMPDRARPTALLVRLRHPQERPIRSVSVNGRRWSDFDTQKEWVRVASPTETRYTVIVNY